MKILVAPLNWGLGHASRCVPLVRRLIAEGHEVILGGDGDSLTLLRKQFPKLRYTYLAPLNLRYSKGRRQVWAMACALPRLISWAIKDHVMLQSVLREEPFDRVISDNRFGLYSREVESVYVTHQLHILLPKGWRWLEPLVEHLHSRICMRYNKVWVPDYKEFDKSLAGALSHVTEISNFKFQISNIEYIGPLSRFTNHQSPETKLIAPLRQRISNHHYEVVAVLSGLEPQRTLLEKEVVARYNGGSEKVLVVQGLMGRPNTRIKRGNITMVPYMTDTELKEALSGAKHIIARSGYSTIMDFDALGLLNSQLTIDNSQIELIPTPGQPEQEYLAQRITEKMQKNAEKFGQLKKKQ